MNYGVFWVEYLKMGDNKEQTGSVLHHFYKNASIIVKISVLGEISQIDGGKFDIKNGNTISHFEMDGENKIDFDGKMMIFFRFMEEDSVNRIFYGMCDHYFEKTASITDLDVINKRKQFVIRNHQQINRVATRFSTFLNPSVLRIIAGDCYFIFGYDPVFNNMITMERFYQMLKESEKYECSCIQRLLETDMNILVKILDQDKCSLEKDQCFAPVSQSIPPELDSIPRFVTFSGSFDGDDLGQHIREWFDMKCIFGDKNCMCCV